MMRVEDVRIGDAIDLEGDAYADDGTDPSLEFELAEVQEIDHATDGWVILWTSLGGFSFPLGHMLYVKRA